MIEKIISGGQTGADRAALDTAIEIGIDHGGWVPKGRKTEDGRLPAKYNVQETNAIDYAQRTEFNILDSDGTLLISRGDLKGGSALTRKLALRHNRSCLHVDLDIVSKNGAPEIIQTWIQSKDIRVLNVAGPRSSEDPMIYDDVRNILRSLLYPPPESIDSRSTADINEAVDMIEATLSLKDKSMIARMTEQDLPSIGGHIQAQLNLQSIEEGFLESSRYISKKSDISKIIIKELWKRLRKTHTLRSVK